MRILGIHKNYFYRDGASAYFLEVNQLLEAQGNDVVPFSMKHAKNLPSPYARYFVDEVDFRKREGLLETARKAAHFLYSRSAPRKLNALIRDHGPFAIAHVHNIYHHLTPSILPVLTRHHIPAVMTLHDYKLVSADYTLVAKYTPSERILGGLEHLLHQLLRSYDKHVQTFIAPSKFLLEFCVKAGWPRERFVHIPYCLDTDAFTPSLEDHGYVAYVGRLSHEKGLFTLLEAATRLRDVPFRIAGAGPLEEPLRAFVRERSLDNVQFEGFLNKEQVQQLIACSSMIVVPSEWPENYPFAVLEAQAMGKVVVGSRIGGIPEQIEEGKRGFLFTPGDPENLASTIEKILSLSVSEKQRIGRTAHEWVVQEHSFAVHYERIRALYDQTIAHG